MATYAIGDVQGCFRTLERLLIRCGFEPARDRVWLAGDLVNRGPRSLEVLRWAVAHEASVTAVLGNHDLYLLARHAGVIGARRGDTLGPVLEAPDRARLLEWLRARPILHREGGFAMVHAGLLPQWTVEEAEARARAIETGLRGEDFETLLGDVRRQNLDLDERQRALQADLAVFTRLRMLRRSNEPDFAYNDTPEKAPSALRPWFSAPHNRGDLTMIVGHWAALGLRLQAGLVALDSGCVWGNALSAYRLEDGEVFQENYADGE